MVLNSYAKLNLYLKVLDKRKDNYHNIETVFERISLADKIILKSRRDTKISLTTNLSCLPKDNANLAYRSAQLLQNTLKVNKGVEIKIIKRIPLGAGLGGGSSNAAAVLLGLNRLWKLNLSQHRLLYFSKKIGCDVPFFIYDVSFAKGQSRGDRIRPFKSFKNTRLWHILVVPKISVSTPFIYQKLDTYSKLTKPKYDVNILILALSKKDISQIGRALFNSLERVTAGLHPQIGYIKERLMRLGVKSILMSGSGPAIFGIVSSRKEAVSVYRQLKKERRAWQVFVARTI